MSEEEEGMFSGEECVEMCRGREAVSAEVAVVMEMGAEDVLELPPVP